MQIRRGGMRPILFHLGQVPVTGYWFMAVMGIFSSILYLILTNRSRRLEFIPWLDLMILTCLVILAIPAGGMILGFFVRIPWLLSRWEYYSYHTQNLLGNLFGSNVFYGGLILVLLVILWYGKREQLSFDSIWALYTPVIPLFMVFGRLGCYFAGCCYGRPVPWGIVFPEGCPAPAGIPLFPSQLAESLGQLILFVAIVLLERRLRKKWTLILYYLTGYGILRFVLEFFRGDSVRGVWILSTSQWISIVMILISLGIWAVDRKRKRLLK